MAKKTSDLEAISFAIEQIENLIGSAEDAFSDFAAPYLLQLKDLKNRLGSKKRRRKTCLGCKAYSDGCLLGYRTARDLTKTTLSDLLIHYPIEDCPKPRSILNYCKEIKAQNDHKH